MDERHSQEYELFEQYYNKMKSAECANRASENRHGIESLPPAAEVAISAEEDDDLAMRLRDEARSTFLKKKNDQLLDHEKLKQLWCLLERHCFSAGVDEADAKAKRFFSATVFAKLQHGNVTGLVPLDSFFNYVMRKTWLWQNRISLSLYDITGDGYLTERDLELYVTELLPSIAHLKRLDSSFHPFYVCSVVRRFMFFLDKKRLGKVKIVDILASGFLDELLELREPTDEQANDSVVDSQASGEIQRSHNWFSMSNALSMYGRYVNLDTNRNGMLSKEELMQYDGGTLTEEFVTRLFQEHLTYEGEMDYKAYLDFVLARLNMKHPASLRYFFKIFDVRQQNFLDALDINYFFRGIQRALIEQDQQPIEFQDIKDEIFDIVKPADRNIITLDDLINCDQGDTIVNILTDVNGFLSYENRDFSENIANVAYADF
ncbi:unnamed protein product [Soboliphyme baturini]|uniref:Serine/threonine-protein phosphatase 2A regulatory subunit B'' subunit gamma n=1 Tax=Soboliphyme baturini TaxID=241478 RepID=A0A183IJX3_9BILA|nr:unnamed protein product [Soboliphyme baturini]